jgi:hypothetical protein
MLSLARLISFSPKVRVSRLHLPPNNLVKPCTTYLNVLAMIANCVTEFSVYSSIILHMAIVGLLFVSR